ncbi:MAG TPA: type II toxin-antitoxin system prevent-host-death family antitoxin [Azospirillaceae bacterium]|nr:type II toxin-antitoxin system prevent-host-death family antitoxin [Azospirillaceae bacterium]
MPDDTPKLPLTIDDAQANLSELIARVEAGEEIVISRDGKPVARLVAVEGTEKPKARRQPGSMKGKVWLDDSFWDPLPDEWAGL